MKSLLYLIAFLFISGISTPQSNSGEVDTLYINKELFRLNQLENRNIDSTIYLSKQISSQAKKIGYKNAVWESEIKHGIALHKKGLKDSAALVINQVIEASTKDNNREFRIKSLTKLGVIQQENYEFEEAVKNLLDAQKLLEDSDPIDMKFEILKMLAVTHKKMKDYDTAKKDFNFIVDNYFYQLDHTQRFELYNNLGNVHAMLKEFDKTEELFNKAYDEIRLADSPINLALITYNLGALYYRQRRFDEAKKQILESLASYQIIGDKIYIERCYRVLGAINMDQQDYKNAEKYYLKALEIAKRINNPKSIMGNYKNLFLNTTKIARQSGKSKDFEKALYYENEWTSLQDSLYQADLTNQILDLEKKYETEKKNNQISLLEKENQIKDDQLKIQRAQRNSLLIFVAFALAILGIFVYAMYYYRRINKLLQVQSRHILTQQRQIQQQNEQLQKSVSTQNKLFGIIAHDLRSPLVSISNFSKLINFYLKDKRYDSITEMAEQMDRKNDHVLELTDNLLSWAKGQSGNLTPLFEKVSLNEIIEECFDLYESISEDKEITLSFAEQNDCLLWADRNMVKTICRNLINNAIKFTPRKGNVSIHFERIDELVKICIRDTGIGISEEKIKTLFDIDSQNIQYGTEGEKSTGLGLSVCKEFTEILGGQMQVESEQDAGSIFCFSVPVFMAEIHQTNKKNTRGEKKSPALSLN